MPEAQHLIMRIHGDLGDNAYILDAFTGCLAYARASVLRIESHLFVPQGLTAIALLTESHASIHTYPELEMAYVDYFSCSVKPRMDDFINMWKDFGFDVTDKKIQHR